MSMICVLLFLYASSQFSRIGRKCTLDHLKGGCVVCCLHLAHVPNIIGSCIVLHNISETNGDHWSDEWMVDEGSHNQPLQPHQAARGTIEMNSSSH